MITQKCLAELKENCTKENVSFSRIKVAYVGEGEVISGFNQSFLTLPDEEQFKYAAMARQVFSAKPEEKMLELEAVGANISPFEHLADAGLKAEILDNEFEVGGLLESITKNYLTVGRYAIILIEDNYDIIKVNSADETLDESEETYHYLMCMICPVKLTDPGLECSDEGIRLRKRDWVIGKPEVAMVYPAFEDRSTDVDHIMYYVSNPKDTHTEVMTEILNTEIKRTIAQHTSSLNDMLTRTLSAGYSLPEVDTIIDGVHQKLEALVGDEIIETPITKQVHLESEILKEMLLRLEVGEHTSQIIASEFQRFNGIDNRALLYLDRKRAERYKATLSHKRQRDLLNRSKNALDAAGQKDLADEIETYMERTR